MRPRVGPRFFPPEIPDFRQVSRCKCDRAPLNVRRRARGHPARIRTGEQMNCRRRPRLALLALAVTAGALVPVMGPRAAQADPVLCERALSSESAKFTPSATLALQRCEDAKVIGTVPPATDCSTDGGVVNAIGRAQAKLARKVAIRCGGQDHTCGTDDDESLVSIGWGAIGTCPGLKGASCGNAIGNCGDIALGQVGFAAQCSDVTAPSDGSCSATITDMSGVVTCVDCDATFASDCMADLGVSALVPYPQDCSPTTPPDFCPAPVVPAMIGQIAFTGSPGTA